ncbi:MAG: ABC transporter permease [Pseudomonadota bacterium]
MIAFIRSGFSTRRSRHGLWAVPLVIVIALLAALTFGTDQFASGENLANVVSQAMPLLIAAIGQLFVILVGGLDLSIGSVISFSTAILSLDGPAVVLIPAVFVLAGLVGLINGLVITRLNVHPIIATLAMQYILLGITRILRPVSGGEISGILIAAVQGSVLGLPLPFLWGLLAIGLAAKILYGSRFGLHLFGIGGGVAAGMDDAARNYGIRVERNIVLAYVACALFAALAGVFLAGRIVSGDPNVGLLFELDAVTAVAIGGTQLSGGVGSLHGTVLGAIIMVLLANGMNMANISPFVQTAIKGGLLLAIVGLQSRKKMGL